MGTLGRGSAGRGAGAAAPDGRDGGGLAPPARRTFVAAPGDAARLDVQIARELEMSRTQAATLIANGAVSVDGRRERSSYRPVGGETVVVDVPPARAREIVPEDIDIVVAFEDEHILVVDKPAGMVVHPAPGNWSGTLVNALIGRAGHTASADDERAGLVHRLDKETSGLLVVAKTDRAQRRLSAALAARHVSRRYAAMIWGHLDEDRVTIERPLARSPRDRKKMAVVESGRAARTDVVRLARFNVGDLLRAHLHTGRTHQIRVHLASIGHPVIGDDTYGGGGARRIAGLPPRRHFLHAAWLRFKHPETGELLDLRSPLPDDLRRGLAAIAETPALADDPDPLTTFGFFDDA